MATQDRASVPKKAVSPPPHSKVLAVIDGSERTGRLIEYTLGLTWQGREIEAVLLGIISKRSEQSLEGYGSSKRNEIQTRLKDVRSQRAIEAAARRFDRAGVAHKERIEIGEPTEAILRVAEEEDCRAILIGEGTAGALRRRLPKLIGMTLATVAHQVAMLAAIPVIVVK